MSVAANRAEYQYFKAHTVTRCNAPVITMVFLLTKENTEACIQRVTYNVIIYGISECVLLHKMDHEYRQQAHYKRSKRKTGSLRLVKSFQIQTVDILVVGWDAPVLR